LLPHPRGVPAPRPLPRPRVRTDSAATLGWSLIRCKGRSSCKFAEPPADLCLYRCFCDETGL